MKTRIGAVVELDSVSTKGVRLSTLVVTMPRRILAEFNTHRRLSRSSASIRAIPVEKLMKMVEEDPFIPTHWTTAQKGMQGGPELTNPEEIQLCVSEHLRARDMALESADRQRRHGLHKQVANIYLEPFMWHTAIVSATEWANFFALRHHPAAEPHFIDLAESMITALKASTPQVVPVGDWHIPFGRDLDGLHTDEKVMISSARCARISYLTHAGIRDIEEDLRLYRDLSSAGHMSPLEHPARAISRVRSGNFVGWHQHRKDFPNEERTHPDFPINFEYPS